MTAPVVSSTNVCYLDYLPTEVHEKICRHLDLATYIEYSTLYLRDHSHLKNLQGLANQTSSAAIRQRLNPIVRRILGLTAAPIDSNITPYIIQGAIGYEISKIKPLTIHEMERLDAAITRRIDSHAPFISRQDLTILVALGGVSIAQQLSSCQLLERLSHEEKIQALILLAKLSSWQSLHHLLHSSAYAFLQQPRTYDNILITGHIAKLTSQVILYLGDDLQRMHALLAVIPLGKLPSGAVLDELYVEYGTLSRKAIIAMLAHSAADVEASHLRALFLAFAEKRAARDTEALANLPTLAAAAGTYKVVKELLSIDSSCAAAVIRSPLLLPISRLELYRLWKRAIVQEREGAVTTALTEAGSIQKLPKRSIAALFTYALEHRNFHACGQLLSATHGEILPVEEIALLALIARESGADFVEVALRWLEEKAAP